MSRAEGGPARRAARRVLRVLPLGTQLAVTRVLLRSRRRWRAVQGGSWARPPLLDLGAGAPVMVVALGQGAAAAAAHARQIGDAALVVTDADDFAAFRRHGLWVEYVPPAHEWRRPAAPPGGHAVFVADRLAAIRDAYRPARVETLGAPPVAGRILVVSTVHVADDPRVRRRTVGVLARHAPVRYATKPPAPAVTDDHDWVALPGGRLRRALAAARQAWRRDVDAVSLHDPELLPLGLALVWLRRVPVVFDLHEDLPAQLAHKPWVPRPLRQPLARVAARTLRLAERHLVVTLAEPSYRRLFARDHPVLPNYPDAAAFGDPEPDHGDVVYVGSVTEARGALLAVQAVAALDPRPRLRLIGTCAPQLAARLWMEAAAEDVVLDLPGFLPHPEAMAAVARAMVGIAPLADLPNYRQSLPTKTLEYLAMGVPVVASDLPGTRAVIGDLPGVQLVPPGDVAAWTAALRRVRDDPRWRAAARAHSDTVRARFAWPADDLWALYRELLAG